jgi:hypothetical protein
MQRLSESGLPMERKWDALAVAVPPNLVALESYVNGNGRYGERPY